MYDILSKKYKKIIIVKTTNIAAEGDHPKVFYKIKPSERYVVCNYTSTCFLLSDDADIHSNKVYSYKG